MKKWTGYQVKKSRVYAQPGASDLNIPEWHISYEPVSGWYDSETEFAIVRDGKWWSILDPGSGYLVKQYFKLKKDAAAYLPQARDAFDTWHLKHIDHYNDLARKMSDFIATLHKED